MSAWIEDRTGQKTPLHGCCVLGRHPDCQVYLPGTRVSRRHAMMHTPNGYQHWLIDLRSANGVFVNGHRIQQTVLLKDEDQIRIGDHLLVFRHEPPSRRTARGFEGLSPTEKHGPETPVQNYGVITLDERGAVISLSSQARRHLVKHFQAAEPFPLPAPVIHWLRTVESRPGSEATPLCLARGEHTVVFRLLENNRWNKVLLLFEEKPVSRDVVAERLGLTNREAEVLCWTAEGKNNREIAVLLNISFRTVEKHLEKVFHKLGIENRQSAIRVLTDAAGRW